MAINVKKAISSASKAAKKTVSNVSKQLSALGSTLSGKSNTAAVANAPMTKYNPGGYPQSTTSGLQASSNKSRSGGTTTSPNMSYAPNMTSAVTGKSVYSGNAPSAGANMTDARTGQSVVAPAPRRNGGSGGGLMAAASGAYSALESMFGGSGVRNDSYASDGAPGVSDSPTPPPQMSTYRGSTGTNQTTYTPGQGMSLEARASQPSQIIAPGARAQNQSTVRTWDDGAPQRQAQVSALQQQLSVLQAQKAAQDAMAPSVVDPEQQRLDDEEKRMFDEESRIQDEIRKLTEPSQEYLEAKKLEDEYLAKEAAIKAGVNRSVAEISDQPIPYGFITGQSASVERRANADLDTIAAQRIPIQQRLANEQARRAAALDVAKTSASRLSSRSDRASDRAYDYRKDTRKRKEDRTDQAISDRYRTIGDGTMLYDTLTGQVVRDNPQTFAPKSPEKRSTTTVEAGGRRLLIDSQTGEVISDLGSAGNGSGREP